MTTTTAGSEETLARQAQHECGHGAVHWALGIPFLRIVLKDPGGGGPLTYPVPGTRMLVGQRCLIQSAGFIADYQRRNLSMRGSQIARLLLGTGDSDLFEVDDPATGQVAVRPSRAPAMAPGGDLAQWASHLAATRTPPAECIAMWRDCEKFTASCRPAIDAMAAELLRRGELDGAEGASIASAAMAGADLPEAPIWARP